jgi:nitrous oxidase accessory protein NosD
VSRRTALRTIAVGGIGSIALGGTSAANPGGKCDAVVPDEYTSIQAAVDAADDGDTVCVEDGTYAEQVVVNKSLTLQNADGASPTVELTDSPESFTIAESGPTWEPMVFAFGGSESDGDVSGSGTVDVDVMGFTIDGGNEDPDARRKPAVLFRNASGDIADNTIESTNVGGKETFGILAYGDSDVTVENNSVSDYERGGIGANGDGGEHPSPSADIRNNTVTGSA